MVGLVEPDIMQLLICLGESRMNIQIITSSYPAYPDDPTGTAGLFVRQFAIELAKLDHKVIVQPTARKNAYEPDEGLTIVPTPWLGGDQELASMNFLSPKNWWVFLLYFIKGIQNTLQINRKYQIERTLCAWAVPSGVLGLAGKLRGDVPYDVWALGSDIWKIRKIPVVGKLILKLVMKNADRVYADGFQLCKDIEELTGVKSEFLPSSRKLPPPERNLVSLKPDMKHFLFVGRYHANKGPDLLIKAIACLPSNVRDSMRLHMFGIGSWKEQLQRMVLELQLDKIIDLNGSIQAQEFSNYLDCVSFLVIPSRIESFPIVLSDSLQIGTPVVSMPVGDLGPFISEHKCGIVAREVTSQALAEALQKASTRNKASFKEDVAKAYQKFEMENTIKKWLNLGQVQHRE